MIIVVIVIFVVVVVLLVLLVFIVHFLTCCAQYMSFDSPCGRDGLFNYSNVKLNYS